MVQRFFDMDLSGSEPDCGNDSETDDGVRIEMKEGLHDDGVGG